VFVTFTRASTGAEPIEYAGMVGEEIESWLRDIDGFEGFMMLSREGTSIGLSFWRSREIAERHRVARMQFIERMTGAAGVKVEEILDFDVTFARLDELLTDARAETG
jgi:hypothetical protein